MKTLWERVYDYGRHGLSEETVDELLELLSRQDELENYASVGKAVMEAAKQRYVFGRMARYAGDKFGDELYLNTDDLQKILAWYDSPQPTETKE